MALRTILIWPDPKLEIVAKPITTFDHTLQQLVQDLFDTMHVSHGIGLAATQIDVHRQVLVIDLDPEGKRHSDSAYQKTLQESGFEGPIALINPTIVASSGRIVWEEGCLSVPDFTDDVERKRHITVAAQDSTGKPFTLEASELFAVAIQHEMDHLAGKVFVSYLSSLKREMIRKKMNKYTRKNQQDKLKEPRSKHDRTGSYELQQRALHAPLRAK